MPIDAWDIQMGSQDPNAGTDEVDWGAVEGLVGLALKAHQQKIEAEKQARRFKGLQEYKALVAGGATPQEALRRTAPDLYADSIEHLTPALRFTQPKPPAFAPQVRQFGNEQYLQTGTERYQHIPNPAAKTTRLSPADQRELDLARRELTSASSGMNNAQKELMKLNALRFKDKDAIKKAEADVQGFSTRLDAARNKFRSIGIAGGNLPQSSPTAATQAEPLPDSQDKLKAGTLYATPKGDYIWTGQGWKKAPTTELPLAGIEDIQEPDAVER